MKIVMATIAPHQAAGFSGGRKSVLPGIASLATLKQHHGFNLRSDKPAMGWVEGNKFHENALEAARMAKVDFILNTVQNQHKEITQVVAGDVEKAWLFSKCLKRADLILVSKKIDDKTLKEMFTQRADTVEEAVAMALAKHGENAKIILMKNGSDMIPRFEGKPENAQSTDHDQKICRHIPGPYPNPGAGRVYRGGEGL
ncbi:MAG: lactate racemase domain-containing protein [Deltaproteobacteria bacterium]|nr:lactate racemase domain-containing protein [Deltaproteobacteria bacterium]